HDAEERIRHALSGKEIEVQSVQEILPSLEDVFLHLTSAEDKRILEEPVQRRGSHRTQAQQK
ncbi:MAG: hypothetical protein ACE5H0_05960, partial [Bacteroidota bacterium]